MTSPLRAAQTSPQIVNPSFIALGLNDWDGMWMNRQQFMSRIGKKHPVIYSNGGWFSWDRQKAFNESTLTGRFDHKDNVFVDSSPAGLMRVPKLPLLEKVALKQLGKRLHKKANSISVEGTRILYIFHPSFVDYIDHIPHDVLIYHCYDNFAQMHNSDALKLNRDERMLLSRADYIFTSSEGTRDRFAEDHGRTDTLFLPNGVDFPMFNEASSDMPDFLLLEGMPEKRVGYVGSINDKLDISLIDQLSDRLTDVSFVFVGRANNHSDEIAALWKKITNKSNVIHYPSCERTVVPSVLKSMDANCLYYDMNDQGFARDGYPLKLHECLASGKPTISAGLRSVKAFERVVLIAETVDEWEKSIRHALSMPEHAPSDTQKRIEVAYENSWDNRVTDLLGHLLDPK